MITIKFTIANRLFSNQLKRFAREAPAEAARALNEVATRQMQVVKQRAPGGPSRVIGKSVQATKATAQTLYVRIGSPHPGAKILHYGGTIKAGSKNPNRAAYRAFGGHITPKNLAIPVFGNRRTPKDFFEAGIKLFVFKSKRDRWFLGQRTENIGGKRNRFADIGKAGKKWVTGGKGRAKAGIRALFVLLPSVFIKARPYMYWSNEDKREMKQILKEHMKDAFGFRK